MKDKEFLCWIHERLEHVHGESPLTDYMHKLRAIIKSTPEDKETKNMGTGNNLSDIIKTAPNTDFNLTQPAASQVKS